MKALTPSFLSLSKAPCRKSLDTSSFSSNHMTTNGSNQLQDKERDNMSFCADQVAVGGDVCMRILTLDTRVRASGKWTAPCSTHCRATSP